MAEHPPDCLLKANLLLACVTGNVAVLEHVLGAQSLVLVVPVVKDDVKGRWMIGWKVAEAEALEATAQSVTLFRVRSGYDDGLAIDAGAVGKV